MKMNVDAIETCTANSNLLSFLLSSFRNQIAVKIQDRIVIKLQNPIVIDRRNQ